MGSKRCWAQLAMILVLSAGSVGAWAAGEAETKPVKLDVPYVPTHLDAVQAMLKLANVTGKDYVFDLGCGDGRIVIAAAKTHKARGFGVDLDPERIRESNENAKKAGVTELVKFKLEDIMVTDVRQASVVALFLLDSVNLRLRPRLLAQLKPGTRVVSNTFDMDDWKSDEKLRHGKAYQGIIYLWIVPAPVGGTWRWKTKTAAGETAGMAELKQQFQVVSGGVRFGAGPEVAIAEASLSGTQIKFSATRSLEGKQVKVVYQGTVTGNAIKGTQTWAGGPSAGTHPWTATRDRVDVAGQWQILAPQHADRNGTLRIRRKAGGLLATYARADKPKEELSLPALYVWGSSIRFEIPSRLTPLVFTGSLAGDAGGGSVSLGPEGTKTRWMAKRFAGK